MASLMYNPIEYQEEKELGTRLPNGAKPLRRLSPRHIELVKAHLDGVSNKDLARIFNMTESTVSRILGDPLVSEIKKQHQENVSAEFDALYGKAVAALRDGLDEAQPAGTRLKAAKLFFEQAAQRGLDEQESAEDVAQRLLAMQLNVNVNVEGSSNGSNRSSSNSSATLERAESS